MSVISQKLNDLGIIIVSPGAPAAVYVMAVTTGHQVFLSGHIAKRDSKPWVGKLGLDMDTATGQIAARSIAIDLLSTLNAHLGSLDQVRQGEGDGFSELNPRVH